MCRKFLRPSSVRSVAISTLSSRASMYLPDIASACLAEDCMSDPTTVVHSDPDILGGTPVFVGTRVPFQTLIDYLEGGHPLAEFLDDFPSVSRAQAVAALDL